MRREFGEWIGSERMKMVVESIKGRLMPVDEARMVLQLLTTTKQDNGVTRGRSS